MKKTFAILTLLVVGIASFFFFEKHRPALPLTHLKSVCEIAILNNLDTKQNYITLVFKNAGVLHNSENLHGISSIISHLLFRKIGDLTAAETKEKFQQLGITHLSTNGSTDDFIISFSVVENQFNPATKFLIEGLKEKFSEDDLSYAKEIFPILVNPENSHPDEILIDKLYLNLYPNHPYGKNTTGSSNAIAKITLNDIDDFMKNNFTLENLKIYYAGNYSIEKLRNFTDNLSEALPKKSNQNKISDLQTTKVICTEEKILNNNIRDVCGIATGIRLDNLSQKEKAALFIIADALFNKDDGKFSRKEIPMDFTYSINNRELSTILVLSSFVHQKDLEKYLKKQNSFLNHLDLSQLENLKLSQRYFVQKQNQKLSSLQSLKNSLTFLDMPFSSCNDEIFNKILGILRQPKNRCSVFISSK